MTIAAEGYAVLPGPLAESTLVVAREAVVAAVAGADPDEVHVGSTSVRVNGILERVPALGALLEHAPLLEAAGAIGSRLDRHDAPEPWSPLTRREFEVACLVARGLTNREMAEELRITARTAGSHLEHIRAKLGVGRRSEIAAWATAIEETSA